MKIEIDDYSAERAAWHFRADWWLTAIALAAAVLSLSRPSWREPLFLVVPFLGIALMRSTAQITLLRRLRTPEDWPHRAEGE